MSLHSGRRGLPGNSSLAKLLAEMRGVRNPQALPKLAIAQILLWADTHHRKTGQWPTVKSGPVIGSSGEDWASISRYLHAGGRGLLGKSSLGGLLAEKRGVRDRKAPPKLSIRQILKWADAHHQRTGEWPTENSGEVFGAPGENWNNIAGAFYRGGRGLPRNLSLAKLLAEKRGVRSTSGLSKLTLALILKYADAHHQRTGEWPSVNSGEVFGAPGENWRSIAGALYQGGRGLREKSSLSKLLAEKRGVPHPKAHPKLNLQMILEWADTHYRKTGEWPNGNTGDVFGAEGETWRSIANALHQGGRGLRAKSSLAKLLADKRGVRNNSNLPRLTIDQILKWADAHYQRVGHWPKAKSGEVVDAPGEKWVNLFSAVSMGLRGLPGGLSLAKLFTSKRGGQKTAVASE